MRAQVKPADGSRLALERCSAPDGAAGVAAMNLCTAFAPCPRLNPAAARPRRRAISPYAAPPRFPLFFADCDGFNSLIRLLIPRKIPLLRQTANFVVLGINGATQPGHSTGKGAAIWLFARATRICYYDDTRIEPFSSSQERRQVTLTLTMLRCPDTVAPETRELRGGEFSIGRGSENDWVLIDQERVISKRHCLLAYRSGGWQLADLSTNG